MSAGFRQRCQSPALQRVAAWLWVACVLLVAVTPLGCAQKTLPAYGEVLLLLSSDMPVPESFDTVILTVNGKGRAFRAANPKETNTVDECRVGIGTTTPLSKVGLRLPTTIALTSEHDEVQEDVKSTLTACKDGQVVFRKDFAFDLPQSGQVRMLRAPIRWLCADRSKACYGCGSNKNQVAPQLCYHQDISLISTSPVPGLCEASACEDDGTSFTVTDYESNEAAGYDSTLTSTSNCFDPWYCFDMSEDSQFDAHRWVQLSTSWQRTDADAGLEYSCEATIDPALLDELRSPVNLAVVLPPGGFGFCDESRCFVPLDADSSVGWKLLDRAAGRVSLPTAVCHMLDSGQILYVVAAANPKCAITKSQSAPVCSVSERPSVEQSSAPLVNFADTITYLPLDGIDDAVLLNSKNIETFGLVNPAPVVTDIAVMGLARRFNSLSFAQGSNTFAMKQARTFAAWVSLTESPDTDATVMPILSNIAKDCASGVRLQLRSCKDQSAVFVALGLPSGQADQENCRLQYTFAPLAAESFSGGYFSPWRIGTFYHVAATLDDTGGPRLYVDGTESKAATTPPCGFGASALERHDGELIYLGSQSTLASAEAASHDLLIDEVVLFVDGLEAEWIRRLMVELSTQAGASGLRWGTWATQGGSATTATPPPRPDSPISDQAASSTGSNESIDVAAPFPRFSIRDQAASSAGAYALLGTTARLMSSSGALTTLSPSLADYDEAVLVVSPLPHEKPFQKPFQFALTSEHGKRQCTWQLIASDANNTSGFDTYVINLRKPSWCVDPRCSFNTSNIDRVSIGSDWTEAQGAFAYKVLALAFRKHPPMVTGTTSTELGGVIGPGSWCWKSVAYDSAWEVDRAKRVSFTGVRDPVGVTAPTLFGPSTDPDPPELAADLPDDLGSRNLTICQSVKLCWTELGPRNDTVKVTKDRKLVLTNTLGQSCSWGIPDPSSCVSQVDFRVDGSPWTAVGPEPDCSAIRKAVTRISVRDSAPMQVSSVECCSSTGDCIDISSLPLSSARSN